MPSPTSSTRPTSRTSSLARYWSISFRRTETISSGLNRMAAFLDDVLSDRPQPGADAGVVTEVTHLQDDAAEQVGVDLHFKLRLALEPGPELFLDLRSLTIFEREGGF